MSNAAFVARQRTDRFRSIQYWAGFLFTRHHVILQLKNVLKFSPNGLQFHDQQTNLVHKFFSFFRGHQLLIGDAFRLHSAAKEVVESGTARRLVPTVVFGIRSLLIGRIGTYQSRAETSAY
jgi:hypothetical protein